MRFKTENNSDIPRAVIVDLDGTLLHHEQEHFKIKGRTGSTYFSKKSAKILLNISKIAHIVIATGRNALSVKKLTDQIPDIHFSGFILENGLVVRDSLNIDKKQDDKWRYVRDRVPAWEFLPGYENCLGLIPPKSFSNPAHYIEKIVMASGEKWFVYAEHQKIFIYPQLPDKTKGFKTFNFHPFIALGNESNDMQLLSLCSCPVTLQGSCNQIQDIVKKKNGFCSKLSSHLGTEDMLAWVYIKLLSDIS